ncbi:hypothetical protein [Aquimarina sp. 2201CG5-10]|uniref:hypothetical protein n=1 Tax=Aquimarina callyspongiae TaxID=3098150 RepID=UPI002AB4A6DE|nr:hypothetical protein [Aquimarina sp. 2201CG5-10]MDY8137372.1 hypothetical protein [Aquimarina sp. 2201CG5-10]
MKLFYIHIILLLFGLNVQAQIQTVPNISQETFRSPIIKLEQTDYNSEFHSYTYQDGLLSIDPTEDEFVISNTLGYAMNRFGRIHKIYEIGKWRIIPSIQVDYFLDQKNVAFSKESSFNVTNVSKIKLSYVFNSNVEFYINSGFGLNNQQNEIGGISNRNQLVQKGYGIDIGLQWSPISKLRLESVLWYFDLDKEFNYIDDEGLAVSNGFFKRSGLDFNAEYQINEKLALNTTIAYAINNESVSYLSEFSAEGNIEIRDIKNFSASIGYRYLDQSNTTYKALVTDIDINYTFKNFTFGVAVQNLLNTPWSEPEFATAVRLTNGYESTRGVYFTPDDAFFLEAGISYSF